MRETTQIDLADNATASDILQAIRLAWQDAGLSGTPLGAQWEDFVRKNISDWRIEALERMAQASWMVNLSRVGSSSSTSPYFVN